MAGEYADFRNRVVVVTGGARGIGSATVAAFSQAGAEVEAWDASNEVESSASRAGASGRVVDVTDAPGVAAAVSELVERCGRIDVLVNNAGIIADAFLSDLELEAWERVLRVHLTGSFLCAQAVVPTFRAQRSGVITNTSSTSALGNRGQANYSAAKAGIIGFTRTLAQELARDGIRVNAIAPGVIDTPMFSAVPEKVREKFLRRVPLGRLGTPEDIARLHLFLASDAASYITGQTIFCDGGLARA